MLKKLGVIGGMGPEAIKFLLCKSDREDKGGE